MRAIIFDMDGTLLDSEGYWLDLPGWLLAEYSLKVPNSLRPTWGRMRCREAVQAYLAHPECELPMTFEEADAWCVRRLRDVYFHRAGLFPEATDCVRAAKSLGVPLILATATERECAHAALERTGLLPYFDEVHSTYLAPLTKADPAFFANILARLGVAPADALLVDDALYAVRTANAAGMVTYAVEDYPRAPEKADLLREADRYFDDRNALAAALRALA